ncbi:MAG TPA: phosphoribosylglycinamide formyltransferase [Brumimicrobium sp.]|nr:phosphoribosylglycinamide formyltransferase [Brumimicrobium sp.]
MKKKRIAIFASGSGSNAIKMLDFFKNSKQIEVALLLSNNKNAGVLEKTKNKIKQVVISNEEAKNGGFIKSIMNDNNVDYIILAGYLRKIPEELIRAFPEQIINIHPALLPKYGGKGMYGMNVHKSVFENKEQESGITIHLVNEKYDEGKILAQHKVALSLEDTPEEIQKKVLEIEHKYFSSVVETYILSRKDSPS